MHKELRSQLLLPWPDGQSAKAPSFRAAAVAAGRSLRHALAPGQPHAGGPGGSRLRAAGTPVTAAGLHKLPAQPAARLTEARLKQLFAEEAAPVPDAQCERPRSVLPLRRAAGVAADARLPDRQPATPEPAADAQQARPGARQRSAVAAPAAVAAQDTVDGFALCAAVLRSLVLHAQAWLRPAAAAAAAALRAALRVGLLVSLAGLGGSAPIGVPPLPRSEQMGETKKTTQYDSQWESIHVQGNGNRQR